MNILLLIIIILELLVILSLFTNIFTEGNIKLLRDIFHYILALLVLFATFSWFFILPVIGLISLF